MNNASFQKPCSSATLSLLVDLDMPYRCFQPISGEFLTSPFRLDQLNKKR